MLLNLFPLGNLDRLRPYYLSRRDAALNTLADCGGRIRNDVRLTSRPLLSCYKPNKICSGSIADEPDRLASNLAKTTRRACSVYLSNIVRQSYSRLLGPCKGSRRHGARAELKVVLAALQLASTASGSARKNLRRKTLYFRQAVPSKLHSRQTDASIFPSLLILRSQERGVFAGPAAVFASYRGKQMVQVTVVCGGLVPRALVPAPAQQR